MTRPVLLLLTALLAGCENRAKTFLGPTAVTVLEQPTRIEAWRIHAQPGRPLTTQPAKDLDLAVARQLATILQDPATYNFDSAKGCIFQPGLGIRLWRDQQSFDVIVCFSCSELKIVSLDPTTKQRPYTTEDFDNARPALVALAKKAFPTDPEIQSLK
jgi:hypothetical protein